MMDFEPIRTKIRAIRHHTRECDKHPFIYTKQLDNNTYLEWEYNDNTIYAKSRDFTLISIIQDCIKVYLEETEEYNETPQYKPHKFKRSGYYKVE